MNILDHVKTKVMPIHVTKPTNGLDILKSIGNNKWGTDQKFMLRLYRSLVRFKLDYGCICVQVLLANPIHNQGLRLRLGTFRELVC